MKPLLAQSEISDGGGHLHSAAGSPFREHVVRSQSVVQDIMTFSPSCIVPGRWTGSIVEQ